MRFGLALALAGAALVLAGCAPASPGGSSARELRQAMLMEAGSEHPVPLPDPWEDTAPTREGTVTYRLVLPDVALSGAQPSLFIARPGDGFRLRLNGEPLLQVEPKPLSEAALLPELAQPPVLVPMPEPLLREHGNQIEIEVHGRARRDAGLSTVWVGPLAELEPRFRALTAYQVRGAWVVAAAATVMGALALLLAWRARRFVYACFGAASLLWAWRVTGAQFGGGGAWPRLSAALFQASYAWFVVLMALYALAAIGRDSTKVRRMLGGWAAVALALALVLAVRDAAFVRELLLAGTFAIVAWLLPVLILEFWQSRSTPALLLAGATAASVVVELRDFWVFRVQHDYGAVPWSRYTILLLLAVLAWLLVDEFARSGADLRNLNRDLQDRVAFKERELQSAFEARREREREQAVLAERDRILREMHDGLGGRLVAALALTAQVVRQSAPPDGGEPRSAEQPLRDLKATLDDCLVELRLALDSLETDQRPLVEALGELRFRVEPSLRAAGVRLVWQVADDASEAALPAGDTLHVLRIVREALTNVIKHAQATVAWLRLERREDGGLVLAVVDNGLEQRASGADARRQALSMFVPITTVHGGRGLANMQRRAAALGATLSSGPHAQGWAVSLVLPGAPSR